jgi:dUTP pyrophosphatase
MVIRIKRLTDTAKLPTRGSAEAAGLDLYVDSTEPVTIRPGEFVQLFTGIAMEIPAGYFGAVYARSGLATRQGLRPPNCVGVIDSDYRGNIGVGLRNDTDTEQIVVPHERVAQIVIQPYVYAVFVEAEELSETNRGEGGFGSTGRV